MVESSNKTGWRIEAGRWTSRVTSIGTRSIPRTLPVGLKVEAVEASITCCVDHHSRKLIIAI